MTIDNFALDINGHSYNINSFESKNTNGEIGVGFKTYLKNGDERKLSAWTNIGLIDEASELHGIDILSELLNALKQEIAKEIEIAETKVIEK